MLGNCICGITGYIAGMNAAFFQIFPIKIIDSCCCQTNQLQFFCVFESFLTHGKLVRHNNIRILYPFRYFFL